MVYAVAHSIPLAFAFHFRAGIDSLLLFMCTAPCACVVVCVQHNNAPVYGAKWRGTNCQSHCDFNVLDFKQCSIKVSNEKPKPIYLQTIHKLTVAIVTSRFDRNEIKEPFSFCFSSNFWFLILHIIFYICGRLKSTI